MKIKVVKKATTNAKPSAYCVAMVDAMPLVKR